MSIDNALYRSQPDAVSLEGIRVEALKRLEKLVRSKHVKADSVVPDIVGDLASRSDLHAYLNIRLRLIPAELPRVGEQILESDSEQTGIAPPMATSNSPTDRKSVV